MEPLGPMQLRVIRILGPAERVGKHASRRSASEFEAKSQLARCDPNAVIREALRRHHNGIKDIA